MNTVGVVCEYNPFHLGHAYHLDRSRALLGGDAAVICVMSGDFVQRGEAALYTKYARAEAACRCGADLVAELPLPWCLASAEGFARGAVGLLGLLGAEYLSFGSEAGELRPLKELAEELLKPETEEEIRALLAAQGALSYAAARQRVLERRLGPAGALLSEPNNILAVEYLKAIAAQGLKMRPMTVRRLGAGHDAPAEGPGPRSASALRAALSAGENTDAFLPQAAAEVFCRERARGRELADKSLLEAALLSRLRQLDRDAFAALPDASGGLGERLFRAVRQEGSLEAVCAAARSKRYPLARVRRVCLRACLGVTAGMDEGVPPYARILAASERGRELLRSLRKESRVPLLTKPAAVKTWGERELALFELGSAAHDLYVLGYRDAALRACGEDWRAGPALV